jgi:TolB-like protein/Tfp pilus assembly protein PilF
VIVLILAFLWFRQNPAPQEAERGKSIAVLPLDNLSSQPDTDYFSDGLTEDIIARLSKIAGLKVINRASVMLYKDTEKGLSQIAEELDVATILQGNVRRAEGRVRIFAELLDPKTNKNFWAETYDRQLDDIFTIQSDVAEQIAAALRLELSSQERERIESSPTESLTAYDFYLRGREYHLREIKKDNENAVELFRRALELDPEFALAHVGLAKAYMKGVQRGWLSEDWVGIALEEARTALSIEPDLPEALTVLISVYERKGQPEKASEERSKALQLAPENDEVLMAAGWNYLVHGRYDEAYPLVRKAVALNPRSPINYWSLGWLYQFSGQHEKAEDWARKALEIQPDDVPSQEVLFWTYVTQDRLEEAEGISRHLLSTFPDDSRYWVHASWLAWDMGEADKALVYSEKAHQLDPTNPNRAVIYGVFLWKTGHNREAEGFLAEAQRLTEERIQAGDENADLRLDLSMVHAIKGETIEACRWMREVLEAGHVHLADTLRYPPFEDLHSVECFQLIIAEIEADRERMRLRIEQMEKEWEQ